MEVKAKERLMAEDFEVSELCRSGGSSIDGQKRIWKSNGR